MLLAIDLKTLDTRLKIFPGKWRRYLRSAMSFSLMKMDSSLMLLRDVFRLTEVDDSPDELDEQVAITVADMVVVVDWLSAVRSLEVEEEHNDDCDESIIELDELILDMMMLPLKYSLRSIRLTTV